MSPEKTSIMEITKYCQCQ